MGRLLEQLGKKLEPVPAGSCLVGVSGGADSVALLIMLAGTGAPITAVHVNHGLRGGESDADELFVRRLCEQYRIPLKVYRPDLRGKRMKTLPATRVSGASGSAWKKPGRRSWCWPITRMTWLRHF